MATNYHLAGEITDRAKQIQQQVESRGESQYFILQDSSYRRITDVVYDDSLKLYNLMVSHGQAEFRSSVKGDTPVYWRT